MLPGSFVPVGCPSADKHCGFSIHLELFLMSFPFNICFHHESNRGKMLALPAEARSDMICCNADDIRQTATWHGLQATSALMRPRTPADYLP